jgi:hypothetical protein
VLRLLAFLTMRRNEGHFMLESPNQNFLKHRGLQFVSPRGKDRMRVGRQKNFKGLIYQWMVINDVSFNDEK